MVHICWRYDGVVIDTCCVGDTLERYVETRWREGRHICAACINARSRRQDYCTDVRWGTSSVLAPQNQKEINLLMFSSEAEINEWCFGALAVREFHWHAAVPGTVPARPSFGGFTGPCLISTLS